MKNTFFIVLALALMISLPGSVVADGTVQKIGDTCPRNYVSEGTHCMQSPGAREAIVKIGSRCPLGFSADGAYCLRMQKRPSKIIPKYDNRCPKGFLTDGDYCVSVD